MERSVGSDIPASSEAIPARSCEKCNQRKTRCSRTIPCTSCVKLGVECIFPPPGRAPRRRNRALKAELVSRVKYLEHRLHDLGEDPKPQAPPSKHDDSHSEDTSRVSDNVFPLEPQSNESATGAAANGPFGQLITDGEGRQYVEHEALVGFQNEIMGSFSRDSTTKETRQSQFQATNPSAYMFGFRALAQSLNGLHPAPLTSHLLWETYERNVAPLVSILHKPTIHRLVRKAATNAEFLSPTDEALVFAVYFAAVASIKPEGCLETWGSDHETLIQHYRFATEQALARANFLKTRSLAVLQALVVFLTALWQAEDGNFIWAMTSVAYRLAQGSGLHRDGSNLGLSPFETEMRRRLWWYIYLLDAQSSEAQAIGRLIYEGSYDTKLPLNVNDKDLSPEATEQFTERIGFTEMTFCLIRCEINIRSRQICGNSRPSLTPRRPSIEETEKNLNEINSYLEKDYLKFCDLNVPIQWTAATITRIALARSWLIAHFTLITTGELSSERWQQRRETLFQTAIDVLEFTHLLETSTETADWIWLFQMYRQWHALIFILSEICVRPASATTNRAWVIANLMFQRWQQNGPPKGWVLWKPLSRLYERAATERTKQHGVLDTEQLENNLQFPGPSCADSSQISFDWTSQVPGPDSVDPDVSGSVIDTSAMDIYREIMQGAGPIFNWDQGDVDLGD
ncbi:unnamed protein product [Penicillium salamii]|uniref:Zn(2)-C6 fungal-type domain-containing protein n=1 Tax=Penicillium salamii TaxID=1612424 RepID=A0A9W4JHW4_9EURO|nr:unnamed protein product [Penicillium salamii]CAG8079679.1 unnamed protein product [Penicillium salamii]CAG8118020.1 unnamed protein product [Penicillium salamii]CAG8131230.1 unnamed protein product [Penicillium salamii]CAG8266847.1 unnamed protein product [Penicillium salamii]